MLRNLKNITNDLHERLQKNKEEIFYKKNYIIRRKLFSKKKIEKNEKN